MDFSLIKDIENRYSLKSAHKRNLCFVKGQGCTLYDCVSRPYVDLAGGENCLGYGDAALTEGLLNQINNLINAPGLHAPYAQALESLVLNSGFNKAALTAGAKEANALASGLIKNYYKENGSRKNIVIAGSPDSDFAFCHDNADGFVKVAEINKFNDLKNLLNEQTAALVIEPLTADSGVYTADYDYLINAYALCKSLSILLVCDETKIGLGRTGKRFAYENYGIQPDIVTLSRGLAGGINAGAVLIRGPLAEYIQGETDTISALACTAIKVVGERLTDQYLEEIADKGDYLMGRLSKLSKHNFVRDFRGKGLIAAIELNARIMAPKVVSQMEKAGYLVGVSTGNVIKICPPFVISKEEIDAACDVLSKIFASTNI